MAAHYDREQDLFFVVTGTSNPRTGSAVVLWCAEDGETQLFVLASAAHTDGNADSEHELKGYAEWAYSISYLAFGVVIALLAIMVGMYLAGMRLPLPHLRLI